MMTASSVEFFPCRVQLIGLPRSAATGNGGSSGGSQTVVARRPPLAKVQSVSRNLFGAPDAGEINQLFREETQRQRSYVLQRYNFDIKAAQSTPATTTDNSAPTQSASQEPDSSENSPSLSSSSSSSSSALPSLIEQELQQHELRLRAEKCNLSRAAAAEITPPPQHCTGAKIVRRTTSANNCCGDEPTSDRVKPYARQTLITESFNIRKGKKQYTGKIAMMTAAVSHRRLEVLQLPRAMQAQESAVSDENDSNNSTLSLQVRVSTQKASCATSTATSSAHTHHA